MEKKYTVEDFLEIIATLRSDHGCPWDREQTHESLRTCMTEEVAEFIASIRIAKKTNSYENMCEELGDILLQVVMHSQIASEEERFDFGDVVDQISRKMVRRHPHVFGEVTVSNTNEVLDNWEEIKKIEKKDKEWMDTPLREVPNELPALLYAPKILKKIDKFYHQREDYKQVLINLQKEVEQLALLTDNSAVQEQEELMENILTNLSIIAYQKKMSLEVILKDKMEEMIESFEPLKTCE